MPRSLKKYKEKRDFSKTTEPKGKTKKTKKNIFVVQLHDATRLHFDFRLEISGVLVSWAIPKGPSPNPEDKRLAVRTEDHPLEYASFEGTIPPGNYGAGTVMIWDHGTYENIQEKKDPPIKMSEALEKGHIEVSLNGKKLRGNYSLIKIRPRGKQESWLLVKMNDSEANKDYKSIDKSAISGKTIKQIAND